MTSFQTHDNNKTMPPLFLDVAVCLLLQRLTPLRQALWSLWVASWLSSQVGVVWHTTWHGCRLDNMLCVPGADACTVTRCCRLVSKSIKQQCTQVFSSPNASLCGCLCHHHSPGGGGAAKVNIDRVLDDLNALSERYPFQVSEPVSEPVKG